MSDDDFSLVKNLQPVADTSDKTTSTQYCTPDKIKSEPNNGFKITKNLQTIAEVCETLEILTPLLQVDSKQDDEDD